MSCTLVIAVFLAATATRQASLLDVTNGHLGTSTEHLFGLALAGIGDVDSDGVPDLAIGDPFRGWDRSRPGDVWVFSGRSFLVLYHWRGDYKEDHPRDSIAGAFGSTVASVGDIDGDGIPDIGVGTAESSRSQEGYVRVFSGRTGNELYTVRVPRDNTYNTWEWVGAGPALSPLADINGDGKAEFLIGSKLAPLEAGGAAYANGGIIQVVSGVDGQILHRVYGPEPNSFFGVSVSRIGDINGDGTPDWIAGGVRVAHILMDGDRRSKKTGYVRVYSGATQALLREHDAADCLFGFKVASAGDYDKDSVGDYLVSSPYGRRPRPIQVFSGRTGVQISEIFGSVSANTTFGMQLLAVPDIDGDGVKETLTSGSGNSEQVVWLISGQSGHEIKGLTVGMFPGDFGVGTRLAVLGDIDGDGVCDWAASVVTPRHNDGLAHVKVFSGKTGKLMHQIVRP